MEFVKREARGPVALVTISRPAALNALNGQVLSELDAVFSAIEADDSVRSVVLTGEGKAFVAGADIAEMRDLAPEQAAAFAARGAKVFERIERLSQPVIAAVNGYALGGGCELALSCDIRVASEKARFGQPEVGLGITPGYGGTQRLPRLVGMGDAMRMILSGQPIDAAEALRVGLVSAVYPPEALLEGALSLADAIAKNAPFAVRAAKRAIREGMDGALQDGIRLEGELFAGCFATEDQENAMAAFLEKRKPGAFTGKSRKEGLS